MNADTGLQRIQLTCLRSINVCGLQLHYKKQFVIDLFHDEPAEHSIQCDWNMKILRSKSLIIIAGQIAKIKVHFITE